MLNYSTTLRRSPNCARDGGVQATVVWLLQVLCARTSYFHGGAHPLKRLPPVKGLSHVDRSADTATTGCG